MASKKWSHNQGGVNPRSIGSYASNSPATSAPSTVQIEPAMTTTADQTSPAAAVRESRASGIIIHVRCADITAAREYVAALHCEMDDCDESGTYAGEVELYELERADSARVHVSVDA